MLRQHGLIKRATSVLDNFARRTRREPRGYGATRPVGRVSVTVAATQVELMFHYASGLRLTSIDLAVDVRTRQTRGFISHAHMDHMAPHELIFCTPATARLVQHRLGQRLIHELPFGEPLDWDGVRLTTFPAGHILGSAMLLAEEGGTSLLYTGDFKLGASATAEPAEPPHADVLVMETTFGKPQYRMPPRDQFPHHLLAWGHAVLRFAERGFHH